MKQSLSIPDPAVGDEGAIEIARVWIANKGLHCSLKIGLYDGRTDVDEEKAWGIMLADLARHVASAMAKRDARVDQGLLLKNLVNTFCDELNMPTSDLTGNFKG